MELTGEVLTRTCERLFALACARREDTGFVAETLLAYSASGALVGTYVGARSPSVAAVVRARSAADVIVVDKSLGEVPDLLRAELAHSGAVAAIHLCQHHHEDGSSSVVVVAAWPARGVAPAFGARFTSSEARIGVVETATASRWLQYVIPDAQ